MNNAPPKVEAAYEAAVVAVLNACPDATEDQAQEVVDRLVQLVFTTIKAFIEDQSNDTTHSH
ncbi:MAG: hypothetical protein ACO242_02980 [Candidatus Fonsibacter ubiquis]